MADKLSRTKELVVVDVATPGGSSPQKSRLATMPFAPLLPTMGSVTTLFEHTDFLKNRLELLLTTDSDNSKEISMLQQVLVWLNMGVE